MLAAVPDEGASQLDQANVVGCLLVVPHQNRTALGESAQGAFQLPPVGWLGLPAGLVQFLFANTPNLWLVSGLGDGPVAGGIVIPLFQTLALDGFRPVHHCR